MRCRLVRRSTADPSKQVIDHRYTFLFVFRRVCNRLSLVAPASAIAETEVEVMRAVQYRMPVGLDSCSYYTQLLLIKD